ncbi:MAG: hypothetical protein WA188_11710, partial [Terriglobales bacterium]
MFFVLPLAILVALSSAARAAAQEWDAPARELAEKIIAHAQSRTALSLTVKNISSLPQSRVAEIERALESELRRRGVSLAEPERALEQARVTLSENTSGYLWVAEIGHDDSWDVVMVQMPLLAPAQPAPAALSLRRTPLWTQSEMMLDVVPAGDGGLLVLGGDSVSLYRVQEKKWQLAGSAPLTHSHPWPRDLRGRLVLQADGSFRAYLPGVQCSGTMQPQFNLACRESDDPWPLSPEVNGFFSSRRNFFTGAVKLAGSSEAGDLGPFYSAAMFAQGERGFWIVAFTSGAARLINAKGQVVTAFNGWGSDVAGISSDCGSGWQVLASRAADSTQPDSLSAYEIVNRDAVEAGLPLEFAGPVTAMWSAADGRSATVIAHNLRTGSYE